VFFVFLPGKREILREFFKFRGNFTFSRGICHFPAEFDDFRGNLMISPAKIRLLTGKNG
jgi:hypothetical protein